MRAQRLWAAEEKAFVSKNYGVLDIAEMARYLGRTVASVDGHLQRLVRPAVVAGARDGKLRYDREAVAGALHDALGQVAASIKWTPDELRRLEEIRG